MSNTKQGYSLILALALVSLAACGKKEEEAAAPVEGATATAAESGDASAAAAAAPAAPSGPETLPGANDVRAALARKDYEGAVGRVIAMRSLLNSDEKYADYRSLYGEVVDTLREVSDSDPKAAQALMTIRAVQSGR